MIKKSFWEEFNNKLRLVGSNTGIGLKYIYDFGKNHKHYLLPIVNGIIGDKLVENNHKLAISMSFRRDGKDVSVQDLNIKRKKKEQTIIIFIHGLIMDEVFWQTPTEKKLGFGSRLEKELSIIPLYIRYNTGKHISQNGREFSFLLQKLIDEYNDKIDKVVLITHSMGGLVAKSACYYANKEQHNWVKKLDSVFLLGVPNDGSFLEKIAHLTTTILKIIPNLPTRIVGNISDQRSNGIKDLRLGFLIDEDWESHDDSVYLKANRTNVEPLSFVKYYILVGTIEGKESSIVNTYFGDGLVSSKSAIGEVFQNHSNKSNPNIKCKIFPETSHIGLLLNPIVYNYIKGLLINEE